MSTSNDIQNVGFTQKLFGVIVYQFFQIKSKLSVLASFLVIDGISVQAKLQYVLLIAAIFFIITVYYKKRIST